MSSLSEYVSDQLEAAVERSDLSSVQIAGWDSQPTEKWAIAWSPLSVNVEGTLGNEAATYTIAVALFAPITATTDYEKHCMTPSVSGSLIGEIAEVGWNWSDWEFGNESPNDSGIKLAASAVATLPAIAEFRDDGLTYMTPEIIWWDIENEEVVDIDGVTLTHTLTDTDNHRTRIDLLDGRPLGLILDGGLDLDIAIAGDNPGLFLVDVEELRDDTGQIETIVLDGRRRYVRVLSAIFKDDAGRSATDTTSGNIVIETEPKVILTPGQSDLSNTSFLASTHTLAWTWEEGDTADFPTTTIELLDISNGEALPEGDPLYQQWFFTGAGQSKSTTGDWGSVSVGGTEIGLGVTGGTDRDVRVTFDPGDPLVASVSLVEETIGDWDEYFALSFATDISELPDAFTLAAGNIRISAPEQTIGDTTYQAAELFVPWGMFVSS